MTFFLPMLISCVAISFAATQISAELEVADDKSSCSTFASKFIFLQTYFIATSIIKELPRPLPQTTKILTITFTPDDRYYGGVYFMKNTILSILNILFDMCHKYKFNL